jgi:hypothetical protein
LHAGSVRRAYVDSVGRVRVMLVRFFPAWCTSIQIVVTLGYE